MLLVEALEKEDYIESEIQLALGAEVNLNYSSTVGTPLMIACCKNNVELCDMLICRGADINIVGTFEK